MHTNTHASWGAVLFIFVMIAMMLFSKSMRYEEATEETAAVEVTGSISR
jgi:hypothetical protein